MSHSFSSIVPCQDLDLGLCVSSGQVFRWWTQPDASWVGVEGNHWYQIARVGDVLQVTTSGSESDFRRLFRLDWSSEEIRVRLLSSAPELGPYMEALSGLRVMRPSSAVETFFCFLCTPNNNVARITSLVRHLASYGPVMDEVGGRPAHRFPTAERISEVSEVELRGKAFGYRGATIPRIARELVSRGGSAYLESLSAEGYEEAHAALCSFHGIGPKLADCICLFALDQTEAVPIDTHLWQAATRLYFPQWQGTALTDMKYREVGAFFRARFGKLAGWAHQYLFYDNLLNWRTRRP